MSASSPSTGTRKAGRQDQEDDTGGPLEIGLEHQRGRHLFWGGLGLVAGVFLMVRMGTFGLVAGAIVLAMSYSSVRLLVLSLLHPPGTIALRERTIVLPVSLCAGKSVEVSLGELKHAYILRRALPWMTQGPVLVVETAQGTYEYPRDWFAGEADQRRVAQALNRRLGRLT